MSHYIGILATYRGMRAGGILLAVLGFAVASLARRLRVWREVHRYARYHGPKYVRKPRLSEIRAARTQRRWWAR